jgi:hypothetical protein
MTRGAFQHPSTATTLQVVVGPGALTVSLLTHPCQARGCLGAALARPTLKPH